MTPTATIRRIDVLAEQLAAVLADLQALRTEAFDDAQEIAGRPLEVVAVVARRLGSTPEDVLGHRRFAGAVRARTAACVALTMCRQGQSAIGRILTLDHSSVASAVRRGLKRMGEPGFRAAVEAGVAVWGAEAEPERVAVPEPPVRKRGRTSTHAPDCGCSTCEASRPEKAVLQ